MLLSPNSSSPDVLRSNQSLNDLDLSNTSSSSLVGSRRRSSHNCLPTEQAHHASVSTGKASTAAQHIPLAVVSEVSLAGGAGSSRSKQLAGVGEKRSLDVVEGVSFGDDVDARADVEGVAGVGVPVVVDGVEERARGDLGGTARGVVDVVVCEGDLIIRSCEIDCPIMMVITGSGPGGGAVEFGVGDGDTVAC